MAWVAMSLLALGALVLGAAGARERGATFHWCVTGKQAGAVDLSPTPIRRDAVIFYEHAFGIIPRYWKGSMERGGVPQNADLAAHSTKMRADIEAAIPDPNWVGYGIIDLEAWGPMWEHAVQEQRDQSIRQARERHPELSARDVERVARADYERGARLLLEGTLRECRRFRPGVKWGVYGWPTQPFKPSMDRLGWLWEASGAVFPSCYVVYKSKVGGVHFQGTAPPEEWVGWTRDEVTLARRAAGSEKEVIVTVWMRYHEINAIHGGQFLERADLETMIREPFRHGADGLVFWDVIDTPEMASRYSDYVRDHAARVIRSVVADAGGVGR